MAIINSVLTGYGRNKIGNVVLSIVKRKTVAKQYQPVVNQPKSPAQLAYETRLKNAGAAWQYCKSLFSNYNLGLNPGESSYNVYLRNALPFMPDNVVLSQMDSYRKFKNREFKGYSLLRIVEVNVRSVEPVVGGTEILFLTYGLPYEANKYINIFAVDSETGNRQFISRLITENEWNNELILEPPISNGNDLPAAYITDFEASKMSNVMFFVTE